MARIRKVTEELIDKFNKEGIKNPNIIFDDNTFRPIRIEWETKREIKSAISYSSSKSKEIDTKVSSSSFHSYYFKYDQERHGLWAIPIKTSNELSKRSTCGKTKWIVDPYRKTVFISKNKDIVTCSGTYNWEERKITNYLWHSATTTWGSKAVVAQDCEYLFKEFSKCFGEPMIITSRGIVLDKTDFGEVWKINTFLNTKDRKQSKKTEEKNKTFCDKINKMSDDFNITEGYMLDFNNGVIYIRMISGGKEYGRIIPNKTNENFVCLYKTQGRWVKKPVNIDMLYYSMSDFVINDRCNESDFKYIQKYISDYKNYMFPNESIINNNKKYKAYETFKFTLQMLKNPILESLLKTATPDIKKNIFNAGGNIKNIYGDGNPSAKGLYARLGINRTQFLTDPKGKAIKFTKRLYNTNDISFIDEGTWNIILECGKTIGNNEYTIDFGNNNQIQDHLNYPLPYSNRWIDIDNLEFLGCPRNIHTYKKILKYIESNNRYMVNGNGRYTYTYSRGLIEIYSDYIQMLAQIKRANDEDSDQILRSFALFPEENEIVLLHDRAVEFSGRAKEKIQQVDWEKATKKSSKKEMIGEKYSIIAPKTPKDLKREGQIQGICIGGYVDRVISERCEIFFIRKNEKINDPYFAVEVQNDKINQIHGKANRWLGNIKDDEEYNDVITLITEWLIKNKLKCNKHILTNMSGHYGECSQYREMPDNETISKAEKDNLFLGN